MTTKYSVSIPEDVVKELEALGNTKGKKPVEILQMFMRLGFLLHSYAPENIEILVRDSADAEWRELVL